MTRLDLEISPDLAFEVAVILETARKSMIANGKRPPVGLAELAQRFNSVTSRHEPSKVHALAAAVDHFGVARHFLTTEQTAYALACSVSRIERLARSGELRKSMIGGHVVFHVDDVEQYAAAVRAGVTTKEQRSA